MHMKLNAVIIIYTHTKIKLAKQHSSKQSWYLQLSPQKSRTLVRRVSLLNPLPICTRLPRRLMVTRDLLCSVRAASARAILADIHRQASVRLSHHTRAGRLAASSMRWVLSRMAAVIDAVLGVQGASRACCTSDASATDASACELVSILHVASLVGILVIKTLWSVAFGRGALVLLAWVEDAVDEGGFLLLWRVLVHVSTCPLDPDGRHRHTLCSLLCSCLFASFSLAFSSFSCSFACSFSSFSCSFAC